MTIQNELSVANPESEVKERRVGVGVGGGFVLIALSAFLQSVIFSLLPKIGPFPKSTTGF